MSKAERDAAVNDLVSNLFSSMLGEIVMDSALQSHQEITRSRTECPICHTRCGDVHVPTALSASTSTNPSNFQTPSRPSTPSVPPSSTGHPGTNTPVGGKSDGNIYLECLNCQRQIASNRYASHLSSCMGLGAPRRGVARNATSKTKLSANGSRSGSPYVDSLNGNVSDDGKPSPTKGKGKSKATKQSLIADEDEPLSNRKRPGSPQVPPSKKSKKAKPAGNPYAFVSNYIDKYIPASPMSRSSSGKGDMESPRTPTHSNLLSMPGSQTKIPSKLSTPSFVAPSQSRSGSPQSDSSADTPIASASTPSSTSISIMQSPTLPAAGAIGAGKKNGKASSSGSAGRLPSVIPQTRPSPKPIPPVTPAPIRRVPDPDYLIDVEGEETGSSSDTDSS
ncbi:hypothetical protein BD410DRAFT_893768 [Rickenella mellea]|uniref:SAGA-associated factor 11 n=1 Tax=Rickenella mellea TaxID=50990 RepID=A0A4Y7QPL9_9AGAM|nr:hypothetical protein BD410DRAFT_893768 [Rickenella mellea]